MNDQQKTLKVDQEVARSVPKGKVKITPSEAFVETLVAQGVTDVFGIVGSAFMDALDLFPGAGIRFIGSAHEQNAAHMADGYARATGRHGVTTGQNGPGVTNCVTGIAAAFAAHSPVVIVTPEAASHAKGLGMFQEVDQLPIFSTITKYQAHVNRPDRIAELTHRAFTVAMNERGPVQINIPRDYFYGEIETEIRQPEVLERTPGGAESLDKAARMLAEAKYPVIVAGGGVIMSGGMPDAKALAEYLTAPVVCSYGHPDAFPASHDLACGCLGYQGSKSAMQVISKADVVLALGTRLRPFATIAQYETAEWLDKAKIIQIDIDSRIIGLTQNVALGICGDAKLAAAEICKRLQSLAPKRTPDESRLKQVVQFKKEWEEELASWKVSPEEGRVSPRQALRELAKARPENAMLAVDIGNVCAVSNNYLHFDEPGSFLGAGMFGNCGVAYPTAIGAKVGQPDRPAIAYVGDGAWGMSLPEVMTCVREEIPVVAVVLNNRQWGAERKNQFEYFGSRFLGTQLESPNFAETAKTMGAEGISVNHVDQVGDALVTAINLNKPTVINIDLTRELGPPFRRDMFKEPVRRLAKYQKFESKRQSW